MCRPTGSEDDETSSETSQADSALYERTSVTKSAEGFAYSAATGSDVSPPTSILPQSPNSALRSKIFALEYANDELKKR